MPRKTVDIENIKQSISLAMESGKSEEALSEAFPPVTPPQAKIDKIEPPEVNLNLPEAFHDLQAEDLQSLDSEIAEHLHYLNTHYCTDIPKEFTSHRFIIGKIVVFLKLVMRPIVRMGLTDFLEQQKQFNAVLVRYSNTIQKKLEILTRTLTKSQELWQNQDIVNQTHTLRIDQNQKYIDHLKYLTKELNHRQQLLDEKLSIPRE